jgi:hypothetical protein
LASRYTSIKKAALGKKYNLLEAKTTEDTTKAEAVGNVQDGAEAVTTVSSVQNDINLKSTYRGARRARTPAKTEFRPPMRPLREASTAGMRSPTTGTPLRPFRVVNTSCIMSLSVQGRVTRRLTLTPRTPAATEATSPTAPSRLTSGTPGSTLRPWRAPVALSRTDITLSRAGLTASAVMPSTPLEVRSSVGEH